MIIIASHNGDVGINDAMQILKNGGSAMDAGILAEFWNNCLGSPVPKLRTEKRIDA